VNVRIALGSKDSNDINRGDLVHGDARVWLDGREIRELVEVSADMPVDGVARVHLKLNATDRLLLEGKADLHVTINPMPGYRLIAEVHEDGVSVYRTEPE